MAMTGDNVPLEYRAFTPLFTQLRDPARSAADRWRTRRALVTGHLPVAQHIARRYGGRGQPREDLEQVAALGLINAVDRFDPQRGSDFLSFAVPTIIGEVRRHFRDKSWAMHVPRRLQESCLNIQHTTAELGQRLGRAPTPAEIAAHQDMPVGEVEMGLLAAEAHDLESLDKRFAEYPSLEFPGICRDDPRLADVENEIVLLPALRRLPARERRILFLRFYGNLTQTEIGQRVGLSQMHVSRLITQSLARLREIITAGAPPDTPPR